MADADDEVAEALEFEVGDGVMLTLNVVVTVVGNEEVWPFVVIAIVSIVV